MSASAEANKPRSADCQSAVSQAASLQPGQALAIREAIINGLRFVHVPARTQPYWFKTNGACPPDNSRCRVIFDNGEEHTAIWKHGRWWDRYMETFVPSPLLWREQGVNEEVL
jgi:hypothetical protein